VLDNDADGSAALPMSLKYDCRFTGFFQHHGRNKDAKVIPNMISNARHLLQGELRKRLEEKRLAPGSPLAVLGLCGKKETHDVPYARVEPEVLDAAMGALNGLRLLSSSGMALPKTHAVSTKWRHTDHFLDESYPGATDEEEVASALYPIDENGDEQPKVYVGTSSVLDEEGNPMKGLFAGKKLAAGSCIDSYFGLLVAFTEARVQDVNMLQADGRGLPNCERALDMTRHGHLLEDTAERKLKVQIVGTKACRATFANEAREGDAMNWDEEHKNVRENLWSKFGRDLSKVEAKDLVNARLVMKDFDEETIATPKELITYFTNPDNLPWLKATRDIKEHEEIFTLYEDVERTEMFNMKDKASDDGSDDSDN